MLYDGNGLRRDHLKSTLLNHSYSVSTQQQDSYSGFHPTAGVGSKFTPQAEESDRKKRSPDSKNGHQKGKTDQRTGEQTR
jgi:hypothetical protein